jgi:hypothetical protein
MNSRIACVLALALSSATAFAQQAEVRINQRLSSESTESGSTFEGSLVRPITLNGRTCAKGSLVQGVVSDSKKSGRLSSPGVLQVEPTSITCSGRRVSVSAEPVRLEGRSHTKRNVALIGGGAAAGSIIGGLLGGGKGALIGAAVGAGGGTAGAATGGRHEATIEPEAVVAWNLSPSSSQTQARPRYNNDDRSRDEQRYRDDDDDRDHDRDGYSRHNGYRGGAVYVIPDRDRTYLRSCLASNYRLPPGLAKKGKVPPGHARKMQQAAYGDPIPGACVARLAPIPQGWSRVIVDDRVLLLNAARNVIDYFIWRNN